MKEQCTDDNYKIVKKTIPHWIENKKAIFYQAYSPKNEDLEKRPFGLVMQIKKMLERPRDITPYAPWTIYSTFKTNQSGMSLYVGVCPQCQRLGNAYFSHDMKCQ